jgi:hypothetical protein
LAKRYVIDVKKKYKDEVGHTIVEFEFYVNGFDIHIKGKAQLDEEQMKYIKESYSNIKGYLQDEIRNAFMV